MFRITRKGDYAVFILSHLARTAAEGGEDALVSAQELASFSALNKSLVANLLKDLTRAGFLSSVRGARGGYRLARTPRSISLGQILQAVEGPFSFVECVHEGPEPHEQPVAPPTSEGDPCCGLSPLCVSRSALVILHARIAQLLDELTLADLCGLDRHNVARLAAELFPRRAGTGDAPVSDDHQDTAEADLRRNGKSRPAPDSDSPHRDSPHRDSPHRDSPHLDSPHRELRTSIEDPSRIESQP
jgi:Rrf2 family protein